MSYLQVSVSANTTMPYTFALPSAKPHELVILSSHQFVKKADESLAQLVPKDISISVVKILGLSERLMEKLKELAHQPVWMLVEHLEMSENWQKTLQEIKEVTIIIVMNFVGNNYYLLLKVLGLMASDCHVDFRLCVTLPLPCIAQLADHMTSFAYHVTALPSLTTPTSHQMQMKEYYSALPISSPRLEYSTQELRQIVQKLSAQVPKYESKDLHLIPRLMHSSLQSAVAYLSGGGVYSAQIGHTLSHIVCNAVPGAWLVGLHHDDIITYQEMTLVDFLAWLRTSQAKK